MSERTVTRADLAEAVYQRVGLSRTESAQLVEQVLGEIADAVARGDNVKLSSFGSFIVRSKASASGAIPRPGRKSRSSRGASWFSSRPTF